MQTDLLPYPKSRDAIASKKLKLLYVISSVGCRFLKYNKIKLQNLNYHLTSHLFLLFAPNCNFQRRAESTTGFLNLSGWKVDRFNPYNSGSIMVIVWVGDVANWCHYFIRIQLFWLLQNSPFDFQHLYLWAFLLYLRGYGFPWPLSFLYPQLHHLDHPDLPRILLKNIITLHGQVKVLAWTFLTPPPHYQNWTIQTKTSIFHTIM